MNDRADDVLDRTSDRVWDEIMMRVDYALFATLWNQTSDLFWDTVGLPAMTQARSELKGAT